MAPQLPETYYITKSTPSVPNSKLPVLIYRSCLPSPTNPDSISKFGAQNHWPCGGVFKHYPTAHFHSLTHECYAVIKGSSRLLLGCGHEKDEKLGTVVRLQRGDAIVLPAGVSHCSLESWDGYEYVGLYPEGSPKYDNNFCKASPEESVEKTANAKSVPVPEWDPIFGKGGPLIDIWTQHQEEAHSSH